MDGLAAGICAIAGSTFAVIALSLGKPEAAILSAIVAGACFGFLRHNFYPARIFMGDSGALLLGFILATLSVQGLLKTAATVALFFPLLVLAIPIVDTSFVLAKRLKYGRPLYEADRTHLHHRFANIGFSQRRAAALHVRLVRAARRRRACDALHPVPRARHTGTCGRRSPSRRSGSPPSPRRSTSSTCSRSSSSRTRGSGAASRGRARAEDRLR